MAVMNDEWKRRSLAALYSLGAPVYDFACRVLFYEKARARAVSLLQLQEGQTVLDVACGTGRNIPLIRQQVGARGKVIGVDYTPAMLAMARAKARLRKWDNVG